MSAIYFFKKKNDKDLFEFLAGVFGGAWHASGDFNDKYLFLADAFDINIVRINRNNKKLIRFGKKTINFNKPFMTDAIKMARRYRDLGLLRELRREMSYSIGMFLINNNLIGLPFTKYIKKTDSTDVYIQIYRGSGEFVTEKKILQGKCFYSSGIRCFFNKTNKYFYILDTEINEDFVHAYRIHKYKVVL